MINPKFNRKITILLMVILTSLIPLFAAPGDPKPGFSANVMAPLHVTDWTDFEQKLNTAKAIGVDAVSVDVWWGDVEAAGDQVFDWSYYDTIFSKIQNAGLHIVPIISFHQCGGNVGDTYTSYLPSWIWTQYGAQGVSADDLKYQSETGAYCSEYVSLWADGYVTAEYVEFMDAFETHFGYLAADIDEINISCGTAGELRYPSYNSHDWGAYPNRGTLQGYGRLAIEDFRAKMLTKYGTLSGINTAWGTSLTDISQVNAPSDPDAFFNNHDYENIQYGRDLIDWYNQSLKDHGKNMITAAISAFDSGFVAIPLGIKIPGVHWMMGDPNTPRVAEMTAGLIQSSVDYQSSVSGYGYANLIDTVRGFAREVILHFTCLEMDNQNWDPQYSRAQDLVFWVAGEALNQGVTIKGENALSGGVTNDAGWDNINNALDWASYMGLTVLRIGEVTSGVGLLRYQQFIQKYGGGVIIHYREFEPAGTYYIHSWDGYVGDHYMAYEGYYNGGHWWTRLLKDAPAYFLFCFQNSNTNWDGVNRTYNNQAGEVYTIPSDPTVYTYRP